MTTELNQLNHGDYQTPLEFGIKVCRMLKDKLGVNPDFIIEPTCGEGNFIKASFEVFDNINKVYGVEIQEEYYIRTKEEFKENKRVKIIIDIQDIEITSTNFKNLNLKEEHIEEFLRKNIEVIFEDETLLVVGKQVVNKENGRSDLTAVDESGNLVLIEIKRDVEDIIQRKEAFEFQAIRYAASYAKVRTPDDLVDKIFASYIEKYRGEFEIGELTAYEKASRILNDFLEKNNALKTFNSKQRIILIASSFDKQTLSAAAWLIRNNVDISCFELSPIKIKDSYFIDINRILPPPSLEDFYVEVDNKKLPTYTTIKRNIPITRTTLPGMDKLFEWGIIKSGDIAVIKNVDNSEATVIDAKYVNFNGEKLTFNKWGQKVTGWSTIRIYCWAMVKGSDKTLHEMRQEKMMSLENEIE